MDDEIVPPEGDTKTTPPPAQDDPSKAELEELRREKAERDAATAQAKDEELAALRKEKADRDAADAKTPPAPKTKAEKASEVPPATPDETKAKKKARVSRQWFGDAADED